MVDPRAQIGVVSHAPEQINSTFFFFFETQHRVVLISAAGVDTEDAIRTPA